MRQARTPILCRSIPPTTTDYTHRPANSPWLPGLRDSPGDPHCAPVLPPVPQRWVTPLTLVMNPRNRTNGTPAVHRHLVTARDACHHKHMSIIIRQFDGRLEEVLVLSARGNVLRVMRRGCGDTAEFTVHKGGLLSEANEPVEIEFMDLRRILGPLAAPG